nr:MAG TPA: Structural protein [Crassvirales sp.]
MANNKSKIKEIDVTKTGPQSYRDLQKANEAAYQSAASESMFSNMKAPHGYVQPSDVIYEGGEYSPLYKQSKGEDTYGSSIWDKPSVNEEEYQNLADIRAENQPWYAQIGAGLAKGAILAGTTFLDGTLGLLFGISEDRWSGLWDNDFSKAMQSVNEWSEQALPNYYTREEQEQPWYENIFTANFLGDKFIKNLGFTVGAFYSGGLEAAGVRGLGKLATVGAKRLGARIKTLKGISKASSIVAAGLGSATSAVNEGRIEAINNSKDWFELHKAQLDDEYHQRLQYIKNAYEGTEVYDQLIRAEQENYNQALGRLSEDRLKMGNMDLLMNIPILTASNIIQFGKLYANGFKTARKTTNIVGKAGEYTAGTTRLGATTAITKGALSEGNEEILQGAASRIAGNYYSTDVNNFYKAKTNRQASQETLDWVKSFAEGINETVNDGSAWEEFFIGFLTGALGMPRFRGMKNAQGGFQSPITIEGGAINEWREYSKKIARENEIANYMNNRINSPEFKNYYQGLIRHNKYQNDMNRAAEEGDEFNFKNAEHAQLVSDIVMFDQAGKLEDLKSAINEASGTSQEDLESTVVNTTSKDENGDLIGPFSQYASKDDNGNIIANFGTEEAMNEMASKINKNKEDILNTIKEYQDIKDELILNTGQQLSDDQLEELTWMKSQIGNWAERATAMSGEVKSAIGNVIGNLDSLLRFNQQVRDFEGQYNADLTDRYKQADKNVKTIEGAINTLNMVRGQNDKALAYTLATNPKFVDGLIKEINEVDETVLSADEKEDITTKLNDIVKLGNASKTYNAKLKEYLENPQKQAEDHARADEQAAQQETKKKSDDLKASLNAAQNLQEFRSTIDAQDNTENRDKVLKELEDEGSEMAKNYRETSQYNNEVRRVLNESDAEPQVKQDAMKLLQDQFNNSDNLEYLANPNSIYINNENAFDEDSEGDVELSATRFQEAQYELQKAMSQVNNDNRFKDRFSPEYKKPVEKREGAVRGDDRTTTGDSGTSTTPTVTSSEGLPTTELPVGNITAEMVSEENKKANERVETPQRPSRDTSNQFYRPAIPELHIEASKEGDFRPFDVVVGEREKGVDFSGIYGYLRDSGAFRYLNEGNLKAGDELGFMIDPSFNDHTIFIIDKRNGQVVGSLDESDYSVSRYEGLKSLEEKIRREYAQRSAQPQQRQFKTDYQYDKEMSFYGGQVHGTLDRVENGTAIYVDSKGQPVILLAGKSDHQFIGIFREPNSNRWSMKMENKEGDKTIFRDMMSSVMTQLPLGAEIYERTSISVDGLRVFAQQLNHGFEIGNETYETDINGGDLANIFGLSKEDQEAMEKVHISEKELPRVKEILRPYLEKFGVKNIDKVIYLTNGNTLSVKLPILVKTRQATGTQSKGKFIATPVTKVSKIMVGRIPYGNTERSLSEIPNVSSTDRKPIFGIIKNGTLTTNGKVDDSLIIKPVDMSQKEGRLYLLIPNGAGKYSPAAVRVKHFNNEEFNLNDSSVSSTPVGEDIKNAITKLSTATSQDDVSAAMQDLAQDLYMQDIMVTWFSSKAGDGIVISKKVRKPDGTYEKVTINGKEQIKEDKYDVYFSTSSKSAEIGGINFDATALETLGDTSALGTPKDPEDIYNEILGHLVKFNLPLQVSTRRINEGAYNNRLINSNILTSNITEASVRSNWFTTDYFDNEGNLHQAISPASVAPQPKRKIETPVGGTEGAIAGTRIVSAFSNKPYYVDLKTNTIRDDQGRTVGVTDSNRILFDLAWAQDNFGNATNSSMMVDNKVLTPDGKVLNRSKQVYLSGQEAQDVKDAIAGRKKEREDRVAKSKEIISEIYENQKRVDKTRTDGGFYYVLEDDGEYHQYSRVHSRLGSNWVESTKQAKALELARLNLSKFVDNPTQYENYLKYLEKKFEVDLTAYRGKTDAKSRDTIVNIVRDRMSGTNSQRALDAGSAVDSIIRQYFTIRDVSKIVRPSNMSENAFIDLITSLNRIKSNMEQMGERFLADNIVLFQKYSDGTRVAGEVDILSIDKDGNFRIYDVKTSRYSFYDFTDRYGHKVNYFTTPSATQRISAKDYYTLQLSAYKNLFESQYGVPVTKLAVMPFVLSYDKENVSAVQSEKGIPITYNPAVNVPLVSNVKIDRPVETPATPAQAQTVLPIFETSLETQNPIEDLTPEHKSTDKDKVGYFELDGKLHKGYITPLTVIDGIEVHVTKVPNITKGFGRQGEAAHVASNSFYAVFPNGKTFLFLNNNPVQGGKTQEEVEKAIKNALEGNKQRVKDLSSEKTILFDPDAVPTVSAAPVTTVETPATINQGNTQTGAAYTVQKEQAIDNKKASRTRHKLRKVKSPDYEKWDEKRELEWLNKVLPQLSEQDRVKVVKGLIKVGKRGTLAWGQFDKGVITLSDIAAEGTAYHEAFHAVFNLLLDNDERQALYDEARKLYGEKDNLSLEEDMAEGFREYVMTRQNAGLLSKIKNFFKDLWIKVTNWNSVRPHLIAYYQIINRGEYSNRELPVETLSQARARQEEYSKEMQDILANAKRDSEGHLLAPNGKKSNLTERQYAQVRTKAFKDWFGDWENNPSEASKVVDENGEPLVVYHGTNADNITAFSLEKAKHNIGIFLSKSKNVARSYVDWLNINYYGKIINDELNNFNIYESYDEYKNRVLESEKDADLPFSSLMSEEAFNAKKAAIINFDEHVYNTFVNLRNPLIVDAKKRKWDSILFKGVKNTTESLAVYAKKYGYDGVIVTDVEDNGLKNQNDIISGYEISDEYIAFNPNQIKSATDNVGTFSRTNDDIRYREVPNSSFKSLDTEMQENLLKKGWTAEKFDSISQEERDQAVKCIAF